MTEVAISARISGEFEESLKKYMEDERLDKSAAVRRLLWFGLQEWKRRKALELLEQGKITFTRGAQLADMEIWDFVDLVKKSGIVWIKTPVKRIKKDIESTKR